MSLDKLVELQGDQTGDQAGGGGDGGDDPAGDPLGLESVCGGDGIVCCSEIAAGNDEVNVTVGVIILLKLQRSDSNSSRFERRSFWKFFTNTRLLANVGISSQMEPKTSRDPDDKV